MPTNILSKLTNEFARDPVSFLLSKEDRNGNAPLHHAIKLKDMATTKILVTYGADINIRNLNDEVPLHLAVKANSVKAAEYLLDNGSLPDPRSIYGSSPLDLAVRQGKFELSKLLIERGADVQVSSWNGDTILANCSRSLSDAWDQEKVKTLLLLLRLGVDPYKVNDFHISPLHNLLKMEEARSLFLSRTLSLERSTPIPWSKFWYTEAQFLMRDDKFHLLVRAYGKETVARVTNIHPAPEEGSVSPLCIAAWHGSIRMMKNMMLVGANIEFEGCKSGTALMAACDYGRFDAVKFLVRHGARLSYGYENGSDGRQPLHRSAPEVAKRYPDILRWLLVGRHTEQLKIMGQAEHGNQGSISDGSDEIRCWSGPTRAGMAFRTNERRQIWESSLEWLARLREMRRDLSGETVLRAELWPELESADANI